MPFEIPSLPEVRALNRDFLVANLPGAEEATPNSPARVLGDANAGLAYQVFLYVEWLSRQLLPDTAEAEFLDRHGRIYVGGRKPATFAKGTVTVTGIAGTVLPNGTTFAGPNGIAYEATDRVTVAITATTVPVRALSPGSVGNLSAGISLAVTDAVAGIDGTAQVTLISGGIATETDASLRDRILTRIREPPQGGAAHDYVAWARDVPGVTRAWASRPELGVVVVRFMMDDDRQDGIPGADDIAAVYNAITARRPVGMRDVFVVAPELQQISFGLPVLSRATESTVRAIESSVRRMFLERLEPGGTTWRSWVDEAVSRAAGEVWHELDFITTPAQSPGHLPVLGTIT